MHPLRQCGPERGGVVTANASETAAVLAVTIADQKRTRMASSRSSPSGASCEDRVSWPLADARFTPWPHHVVSLAGRTIGSAFFATSATNCGAGTATTGHFA